MAGMTTDEHVRHTALAVYEAIGEAWEEEFAEVNNTPPGDVTPADFYGGMMAWTEKVHTVVSDLVARDYAEALRLGKEDLA